MLATQNETIQSSKTPDTQQPAEMTTPELIDFILKRYHEVHREQFEELIELATRVELVHIEDERSPFGLAKHLMAMQSELEQHMFKEENILFPMLQRGQASFAAGPIHVMREDHDDHRLQIEKILTLTQCLTLPEDACNTWKSLYQGLGVLIVDLNEHIRIENDILFMRDA